MAGLGYEHKLCGSKSCTLNKYIILREAQHIIANMQLTSTQGVTGIIRESYMGVQKNI